jgi:hypothetical protein
MSVGKSVHKSVWRSAFKAVKIPFPWGGVTVVVTFSESNNVQGATITCNGESQDTDVNGEAQFELYGNKNYNYTITKTGYEDYNGTLIVGSQNFTESITLSDLPEYLDFITTETGAFSGTITMGVGGASVNYNYT